jgi:hypothetical protein
MDPRERRRAEVDAFLARCRAEGRLPPEETPAEAEARVARTRAEIAGRRARPPTPEERVDRLIAIGVVLPAERSMFLAAARTEPPPPGRPG